MIWYVMGDGDRVGFTLEGHLRQGNLVKAGFFSESINQAIGDIREVLKVMSNVDLIYAGGDDVCFLFQGDLSDLKILMVDIKRIFKSRTGNNFSMGFGSDIESAMSDLNTSKSLSISTYCHLKGIRLH